MSVRVSYFFTGCQGLLTSRYQKMKAHIPLISCALLCTPHIIIFSSFSVPPRSNCFALLFPYLPSLPLTPSIFDTCLFFVGGFQFFGTTQLMWVPPTAPTQPTQALAVPCLIQHPPSFSTIRKHSYEPLSCSFRTQKLSFSLRLTGDSLSLRY